MSCNRPLKVAKALLTQAANDKGQSPEHDGEDEPCVNAASVLSYCCEISILLLLQANQALQERTCRKTLNWLIWLV